jgi:protein O-mannosyl-transferase
VSTPSPSARATVGSSDRALPQADTAGPASRATGPSRGFCHTVAVIGLLVLTAGTFVNALRNGFVTFDDWVLVEQNAMIRSLSVPQVVRMFTHLQNDTWLPLRVLSYAVDYRFWGMDPFGYHLTNILLHMANALLVYALLVRLLGRWPLAWLGAAWFAVHPVQVESVTWIAGRRDVLYAFFFLLSLHAFLAFLRASKHRRWLYVASLGAFVAAMLSKASGMMLPAVLVLLVAVIESGGDLRRRLWACLPHAVVSVVLTGAHLAIAHQAGIIKPLAFGQRLASVPWIFATYWRLLFFPVHLSTPHAMAPLAWTEVGRILGCTIAVVGVVALVWWAAPRRTMALFCLGWWFLLLLPVAHLLPLSILVAERYLYLPLVGACLFGAELVGRLAQGRLRPLVAACALLLVALFAVASHSRNRVWKDSQAFWQDGLSKWPRSPLPRLGLAVVSVEQGRLEDAWARYMSVLSPGDPAMYPQPEHREQVRGGVIRCYDRVARRLEAAGKPAEALEVLQQTASLFPKRVDVAARLTEAYERQGLRQAAASQLARAKQLYAEQQEDAALARELGTQFPWLREWMERRRLGPLLPIGP